MKKLLTLFLIFTLTLLLFSCGKKEEYISDGYDYEFARHPFGDIDFITNTPTKIIYDDGYLSYYSKADGKCYIFSSDPLGNYENDILQNDNGQGNLMAGIEYCNGRIYVVIGSNIYSAKLDATDVKMVYSNSNDGSDGEGCWIVPVTDMGHYNQYLYFGMLMEEGNRDFIRYDSITEKYEDLTEKTGIGVSAYFFSGGYIYFTQPSGSLEPLYRANLDLTDVEEVEGCQIGVCDGEYTYYTLGAKMYRDSLADGTTETILDAAGEVNMVTLYCITDNNIYYSLREKVAIGEYYGNMAYNYSGGKIWRMDKDGGNKTLVMDDLRYDATSMYWFDGEFYGRIGTCNLETGATDCYTAKFVLNAAGEITGFERMKAN